MAKARIRKPCALVGNGASGPGGDGAPCVGVDECHAGGGQGECHEAEAIDGVEAPLVLGVVRDGGWREPNADHDEWALDDAVDHHERRRCDEEHGAGEHH